MRSTKGITTGAMMLAIFGAALLIDRQLSFLFIDFLVLISSILVIVYGNKFGIKNGLIFSIALLLISSVVSPLPRYICFYIASVIAGNLFNYLLKKGVNVSLLIISMTIIYSVAELLDLFVISSLFYGRPFSQYITETIEALKQFLSQFASHYPQEAIDIVSNSMLNVKVVESLIIAGSILTGLMEALIVYVISIISFKRLKIETRIKINKIAELKPVPAYILFGLSCLLFIANYINDSTILGICYSVSIISMLILGYFGYIYLLMLTRLRYRKNYAIFIILGIVLLFPLSLFILFFIGFLYGTGPLKKYLYVERNNDEQN